jgi:hypothetical protein
LLKKWRPPFFSLSGAKKGGRYKGIQVNCLCREVPPQNRKNGAFSPSKKRHFSPFLVDGWVVRESEARTAPLAGAATRKRERLNLLAHPSFTPFLLPGSPLFSTFTGRSTPRCPRQL